MDTVASVLTRKRMDEVCTIAADATVFEAIEVFAENNLGALIVTDHGRLAGVITERDYVRKIVLKGKSSKTTRVRDIMSDRVLCVTPQTTVEQCISLMINRYIRHLPVVEHGRLVGIISMGDVVKSVVSQQEFLISELTRYITDSPVAMKDMVVHRDSLEEPYGKAEVSHREHTGPGVIELRP